MGSAMPAAAAAARALVFAGCALGVANYALAFLPVDLGMWPESEPVVIANLAAAALVVVGLALGLVAGPPARPRVSIAPVVAIPAALAAWGALTAPAAAYPWWSILGVAFNGDGVLGHANAAAFAAGGLALARARRLRLALVLLAVATAAAAALVALDRRFNERMQPEFYAFYALAVAPLLAAWLPPRLTLPWHGRRIGIESTWLALAAAAPVLAVSGNRVALVLAAAVGAPAFVALRRHVARPAADLRRARGLAALGCLLVPVGVFAGIEIVGSLGLVESLRARSRAFEIVAAQLALEPSILAVGQGWGHMSESTLRLLLVPKATLWDWSWDTVWRSALTTGSVAAEALMGAGVPALVAVLVLPALLPLVCSRRDLPLAAAVGLVFAGLGVAWYQLAVTLPMTALAWAALSRRGWIVARPRAALRGAAVGALGLLAIAQLSGAVKLFEFGWGMRAALAAARSGPPAGTDGRRCADLPDDSWRADLGRRYALVSATNAAVELARAGRRVPADRLDQLLGLACAVDRQIARQPTLNLLLADLRYRGDVVHTPGLARLRPEFAALSDGWDRRVRLFLDLAPERSDMAILYLAWAVRADPAAAGRLAEDILARRPSDPVGLWFAGLTGLESPDPTRQRRSVQQLRDALDAGIERLMPIDPKVKAELSRL